nr:regulatory protein cys-3 [Quercus suber]
MEWYTGGGKASCRPRRPERSCQATSSGMSSNLSCWERTDTRTVAPENSRLGYMGDSPALALSGHDGHGDQSHYSSLTTYKQTVHGDERRRCMTRSRPARVASRGAAQFGCHQVGWTGVGPDVSDRPLCALSTSPRHISPHSHKFNRCRGSSGVGDVTGKECDYTVTCQTMPRSAGPWVARRVRGCLAVYPMYRRRRGPVKPCLEPSGARGMMEGRRAREGHAVPRERGGELEYVYRIALAPRKAHHHLSSTATRCPSNALHFSSTTLGTGAALRRRLKAQPAFARANFRPSSVRKRSRRQSTSRSSRNVDHSIDVLSEPTSLASLSFAVMSNNFTARRAPNVSAYLANLNSVPSAQDVAAQSDFDLGDDGLDFLTNTEFFDFDNFNPDPAQQRPNVQKSATPNGTTYQFGEFQTFPNNVGGSPNILPPSPTNGVPEAYPYQAHQLQHNYVAQSGGKRKSMSASVPTTAELEESSRMAAEEDKRRRNTAASARFRVKKKQREQALEKATKEMTDKVQALETKVQQLEMENKWLKELITEKSDGKTVESKLEAKAGEAATSVSSTETRNDGVGTVTKEESKV